MSATKEQVLGFIRETQNIKFTLVTSPFAKSNGKIWATLQALEVLLAECLPPGSARDSLLANLMNFLEICLSLASNPLKFFALDVETTIRQTEQWLNSFSPERSPTDSEWNIIKATYFILVVLDNEIATNFKVRWTTSDATKKDLTNLLHICRNKFGALERPANTPAAEAASCNAAASMSSSLATSLMPASPAPQDSSQSSPSPVPRSVAQPLSSSSSVTSPAATSSASPFPPSHSLASPAAMSPSPSAQSFPMTDPRNPSFSSSSSSGQSSLVPAASPSPAPLTSASQAPASIPLHQSVREKIAAHRRYKSKEIDSQGLGSLTLSIARKYTSDVQDTIVDLKKGKAQLQTELANLTSVQQLLVNPEWIKINKLEELSHKYDANNFSQFWRDYDTLDKFQKLLELLEITGDERQDWETEYQQLTAKSSVSSWLSSPATLWTKALWVAGSNYITSENLEDKFSELMSYYIRRRESLISQLPPQARNVQQYQTLEGQLRLTQLIAQKTEQLESMESSDKELAAMRDDGHEIYARKMHEIHNGIKMGEQKRAMIELFANFLETHKNTQPVKKCWTEIAKFLPTQPKYAFTEFKQQLEAILNKHFPPSAKSVPVAIQELRTQINAICQTSVYSRPAASSCAGGLFHSHSSTSPRTSDSSRSAASPLQTQQPAPVRGSSQSSHPAPTPAPQNQPHAQPLQARIAGGVPVPSKGMEVDTFGGEGHDSLVCLQ